MENKTQFIIFFVFQNKQFHDVKLIDFQTVVYGSPIIDLISFLILATSREMRNKCLEEFLNDYYESFSILLGKLGGNSDDQFPKHIFQKQLKRLGKIGVGLGVFALPQYENYPFENKNDGEHIDERKLSYKQRMNGILEDTISFFCVM